MNRLLLVPILGLLCASSFAADDWPQWLGPQRDGVWRESGIVEKFSSDKLTPRWRVSIGPGYLTRNADSAPSPMRTQKGISYQ